MKIRKDMVQCSPLQNKNEFINYQIQKKRSILHHFLLSKKHWWQLGGYVIV